MEIETKYNIEQEVYTSSCLPKHPTTVCTACKGSPKINLNGHEYTCKTCDGTGKQQMETVWEYKVILVTIRSIDLHVGKDGVYTSYTVANESMRDIRKETSLYTSMTFAQLACDNLNKNKRSSVL